MLIDPEYEKMCRRCKKTFDISEFPTVGSGTCSVCWENEVSGTRICAGCKQERSVTLFLTKRRIYCTICKPPKEDQKMVKKENLSDTMTCSQCKITKHFDDYNKCHGLPFQPCKDCRRLKRQSQKKPVDESIIDGEPEGRTRSCIICFEEKPVEEFYLTKKGRDSKCIECNKTKTNQFRKDNIERIRQYDRERYYAKKNGVPKPKMKETKTFLSEDEKLLFKQCSRCRHVKDPEFFCNENGKVFKTCIDCRDQTSFSIRKKRMENPNPSDDRYSEKEAKLRLYSAVRTRIMKNPIVNSLTTEELLGCEKDYFLDWMSFLLELDKDKGMTWNNYGYWHMDHVNPLSNANLTSEESIKKILHWTNVRPLTGSENIRKSNKIIELDLLRQEDRVKLFKATTGQSASSPLMGAASTTR